MIISVKENKILESKGFHIFHKNEVDIYYSGVLFFSGRKIGEDSLEYLLELYCKNDIDFRSIYGCYAIIINDSLKNQITFFSDNSGMHGIWLSEEFVGNNIAEVGSLRKDYRFNKKALCEYLTFHRFYLTDSIVDGVGAADHRMYYEITQGKMSQYDKKIGEISGKSNICNPYDFFKDVGYAFSEKKVVCALTGGYDSRLVTAAYSYYSQADCFISGDNFDSAEIITSKEVAKAGGIRHLHIIPEKPEMSGDELIKCLFEHGQYKVRIGTHGYRRQYFMDKLAEKYDVLLSGNAGDMHKYFWDTRKVPLYPIPLKPNMRKLVDKLFRQPQMVKYLGKELLDAERRLQQDAYEHFDGLRVKSTVKSYLLGGWNDWISYKLLYTESQTLPIYVPLQEYELVKYSYGIAPRGKTLSSFHRKITSHYNKKMAKVNTIYFTNAGNDISDYVRDFFVQYIYWGKMIFYYLTRKFLHGKKRINESVNKLDLSHLINDSLIVRDAISWAVREGFLNNEMKSEVLPSELKEKIIYIYMLDEKIRSARKEVMEAKCSK